MEKLLAFHFDETELFQLRQLAAAHKIRLETVEATDYKQSLEALASGRKNPLTEPFTGEVPEENLLLLCDFSEKRLDKLLLSLRKSPVQVDFKAVLTPNNKQWNVLRLLLELAAEKDAYERQHHTPGN